MAELPTDPAERLRLAAAGRRVYAQGAPDDQRAILEIQAAAYETAAKILTNDTLLRLVIPSWSFSVEEFGPGSIDP